MAGGLEHSDDKGLEHCETSVKERCDERGHKAL